MKMSRLTVRLPDTLHQQLNDMAKSEGISLNQYIVYALTRQITLAYTVQPTPASEVNEQRATYTALLQNLGQATFEEVETAMKNREQSIPERELTPEVISRLQKRLVRHSSESSKN
jgi:metal-responsive CopG/Arc/MetJ family transcriptional regulator